MGYWIKVTIFKKSLRWCIYLINMIMLAYLEFASVKWIYNNTAIGHKGVGS